MAPSQRTVLDGLNYETVRSSSKLLIAAFSVLFMLSLVSLVPGIDLLIPTTPITLFAIAGAIAALTIAGLLVYMAPGFARIVRTGLDGPDEVVEDVAFIVQSLMVLLAVLVAYRGLAPAVTPLLDDVAWVYDVLFLVLMVPLLVVIAVRMFFSIDPAADLVADKVMGPSTEDGSRSETG